MSGSFRSSVRLSARLSVTLFSQCSYHCIIIKFSGVITINRSDINANGQDQRSKIKMTTVKTNVPQFYPFPDHPCNSSLNSLMVTKWCTKVEAQGRGALLLFKVMRQISRSHRTKIRRFQTELSVSRPNSSLNSSMAIKWCTAFKVTQKRCPIVFQGRPYFKVVCQITWDRKSAIPSELSIFGL